MLDFGLPINNNNASFGKQILGEAADVFKGTVSDGARNAVAQGTAGVAVGAANSVFDVADGILGSTSEMAGSWSNLITDPLRAGLGAAKNGIASSASRVMDASNNYGATPSQRMSYQGYYQLGGGGMVPVSGPYVDGSVGSIAASLGMFTADEAQLYSLIQDPTQRAMFVLDKRMKQQGLLASMLTNMMAAKQQVLSEMGRNLRT